MYAEQLEGDKEMEEFLCNVDERIKFEDTLRWPEGEESRYRETLEQLVDISKSFFKTPSLIDSAREKQIGRKWKRDIRSYLHRSDSGTLIHDVLISLIN